jgi:ribonuclease HIII
MSTHSGKYLPIELEKYRKAFEGEGADFSRPQYMVFCARGAGFVANFYESGKYVLQGARADELFGEYFGAQAALAGDILPLPHIGIDESGKGDFFGPLVIAGVLCDEDAAKTLLALGVCDSKKLDDKKILKLAPEVKRLCTHDVISISPKKYNELYASFKNLNKLLAWGHATVLENILTRVPCDLAISDKFADESVILRALKEKGKAIKLIQRTKAEEDIAVACASVLARAEFVLKMAKLSQEYELDLPKGASAHVVSQGRKFAQKYGAQELKNVAKTHFKTYENCLSR